MKFYFFSASLLVLLSGCGSITGLPAHGGGKRFFVEQELVNETLKKSVQDIDLSSISGRKAMIMYNVIDDTGGGALSGGRYTLESFFRGEYSNDMSWVNKKAHSGQSSQDILVISDPSKISNNRFAGGSGLGLTFNSPSEYYGSPGGSDEGFARRVIENEIRKKGIILVNSSYAEKNAYNADQTKQTQEKSHDQESDSPLEIVVNIGALGLKRTRSDMVAYNVEKFIIRSSVSISVYDKNGSAVVPENTSKYDGTYKEEYVFWNGPYNIVNVVEKVVER